MGSLDHCDQDWTLAQIQADIENLIALYVEIGYLRQRVHPSLHQPSPRDTSRKLINTRAKLRPGTVFNQFQNTKTRCEAGIISNSESRKDIMKTEVTEPIICIYHFAPGSGIEIITMVFWIWTNRKLFILISFRTLQQRLLSVTISSYLYFAKCTLGVLHPFFP